LSHSIIRNIIQYFSSLKEFPNWRFIEKRHAKDAQDIKRTAVKIKIVFGNCYKTISRNSRVYLDSDGILCDSPEGFYMQVLLDPFKEQFNLPSILIKQCNKPSSDFKVVGKICKRPLVFRRVINDTSEKTWIFFACLLSRKPYRLVVENIVRTFQKVFTIDNFILKMPSFPNYEVGPDKIDSKKSFKIKVCSVKDIIGIRLVRNLIHSIHVMNFGFSNMKKSRDLGNNITECMDLNTSFCLAEVRSPKKIQTQIYSSGIESVEPAGNLKLSCNPLTLSNGDHFICKFLKDLVVPVRICLGKIAARFNELAKP
jgi:hypothetical protein